MTGIPLIPAEELEPTGDELAAAAQEIPKWDEYSDLYALTRVRGMLGILARDLASGSERTTEFAATDIRELVALVRAALDARRAKSPRIQSA